MQTIHTIETKHQKFSKKLTVPQMQTIEVLMAASEWEKYDTQELIERGKEVAKNEAEFQLLIDEINSWETETVYAGSWSKSASVVSM